MYVMVETLGTKLTRDFACDNSFKKIIFNNPIIYSNQYIWQFFFHTFYEEVKAPSSFLAPASSSPISIEQQTELWWSRLQAYASDRTYAHKIFTDII